MKYFYIIRFLKKPIVKIGISRNMENRIRQHYSTYRELELDMENIEVVYGDSAKIRLLETYIKCKYDHLEVNLSGYTELFSSDHDPDIISTINRVCYDLELEDMKHYIPKFESKITNSETPNYENDTKEKVNLFVSLFIGLKDFIQSVKQNEHSEIAIEFDLEGMELELIRTLYNYTLNIEYTFQGGWGASNLIISRRLFHYHNYESFDPKLYTNGLYFGVVDEQDQERAIETAHKIILKLKLNPLFEHYPEIWSLLPNELKFEASVAY